jgi:hypothetical protein
VRQSNIARARCRPEAGSQLFALMKFSNGLRDCYFVHLRNEKSFDTIGDHV